MDERDPRYPAQQDAAGVWHSEGPSLHQFQQAGAGFVLPGAPSGQQPLSGAHGFVGTAQPRSLEQSPPQAWGFPTPHGMQLVQHGALPVYQPMAPAPQLQQPPQQHWLQPAPAGGSGAFVSAAPQRMARRVRWETIVPAAAIMCFVAAVGLFVADFDSITGRAKPAAAARSDAPLTGAGAGASDLTTSKNLVLDGTAPTGSAAATTAAKQLLAESRAYLAKGSFEAAATTLDPLLAADAPLPAVTRLSTQIAAAARGNTALLKQLTHQQAARNWAGAIATIGQLKALRPLSPQLAADLRQARAKLLLTATGTTAPTASPSNAGSQMAPATPVRPTGSAAKPPASVPSGNLPPRPDAPKPAGNAAGGGGALGGMPPAPTTNPSGMGDMVM